MSEPYTQQAQPDGGLFGAADEGGDAALKPCPFCGGEALRMSMGRGGRIICEDCDGSGPHSDDGRWSNRPREAALLEVVRLGVEMRQAQSAYFKNRTKENLIASKQAEAAFDKAAGVIQ